MNKEEQITIEQWKELYTYGMSSNMWMFTCKYLCEENVLTYVNTWEIR